MFEYRPSPKPTHKRIKPTQRMKGDISPKVRKEVRERSGGLCERCVRAFATEMAHLIGRKHIEHKTTAADLLHVCRECHVWLDQTPDGIRWKRERVK